MPNSLLAEALTSIDWNKNVQVFCSASASLANFEEQNMRLAVWSRQIEAADGGRPAISFIREMQTAGHTVPALTALAMYKAAAAAMRTTLETALYYTYFRTHVVELETLVRERSYFITKKEILDYHGLHTPGFKDCQAKLGLVTSLNEWYSEVSAIVHGQIPGGWTVHSGLHDTVHKPGMIEKVAVSFEECVRIVHLLFLATISKDIWGDVAHEVKQILLKGLPGEVRQLLGLSMT